MTQPGHPTSSDWMQFVYNDVSIEQKSELEAHLDQCSSCRSDVDRWRAAMSQLDQWSLATAQADPMSARHATMHINSLPSSGRLVFRPQRATLFAASTACVLLAFLAGRSLTSAGVVDTVALRADLKRELVREIRADLAVSLRGEIEPLLKAQLASLKPDASSLLPLIETESSRIAAATVASWAQQDSAARAGMQQMLAGVLENQLSLRSDLETLAMQAEAQILRTRRELLRLAATTAQDDGAPLIEAPDGDDRSM